MNRRKLSMLGGFLTATLFFNQVCQSEAPAPQAPAAAAPAPAAPAPAAAPAAPASTATGVTAKAAFQGTAPVMAPLKRESDPFCGKTKMTDQEVLINANGTLKNVVVRVVTGAAPATPPAEPAVMLNQDNCMYTPRVVVGVVGQKILIKNSDPTMHNVHAYSTANNATLFNQAQMKGAKDIEKTIAAGATKFKCDVHPWMTGWVIGNENPFFCVTGDTGECSLPGLPDGAYTIEAWHEKYGAKTMEVTVTGGKADVNFTFGS